MTDAEREAWERRLQRGLTTHGRQQLTALMEHLGDPPRLGNVPASFWDGMSADMRQLLQPRFEQLYLAMAQETLNASPIGVDWDLVNERAARWASGYSGSLVRRLTLRTRVQVQEAVSDFFRTPTTFGQLQAELDVPALRDKLGRVIMPETRAEMIATTEVTRASDQGQAAIVRQIKADNPAIRMREFWDTNNDEMVCPICGSLHGVEGDGNGNFTTKTGETYQVPAHPRCRCRRIYKLVMPGTRVGVEL